MKTEIITKICENHRESQKVLCSNCKWVQIYEGGDGYNEPRETYVECNCEKAITDEDLYYIEIASDKGYDDDPVECKFFEAGNCMECGELINKNLIKWVSGVYEGYKTCSNKCQDSLQHKMDVEMGVLFK